MCSSAAVTFFYHSDSAAYTGMVVCVCSKRAEVACAHRFVGALFMLLCLFLARLVSVIRYFPIHVKDHTPSFSWDLFFILELPNASRLGPRLNSFVVSHITDTLHTHTHTQLKAKVYGSGFFGGGLLCVGVHATTKGKFIAYCGGLAYGVCVNVALPKYGQW